MQDVISKKLVMITRSGNKFRVIDIPAVSNALGNELSLVYQDFKPFRVNDR